MSVVYFLGGGQDQYSRLRSNGDASEVSGVRDQAFTYPGGDNGPGTMFVKGDKAVILEFHNMNPGETALVTLARQAAARVS